MTIEGPDSNWGRPPYYVAEGEVDYGACPLIPIHTLGEVQPRAALVVFDASKGLVVSCTDNAATVLGVAAEDLVGEPLTRLLYPEAAKKLLSEAREKRAWAEIKLVGRFDRPEFEVYAHTNSQGFVLLEFAPRPVESVAPSFAYFDKLEVVSAELNEASSLAQLYGKAAAAFRELSGFDRVVIYQFDAEFNGAVVGEAKDESVAPYLGLHFPASDIPPRARRLFQAVGVRNVADLKAKPALIMKPGDLIGAEEPLDLSLCEFRYVSQYCNEFYANMGVQATLVVAIEIAGRLWGMVSGHHFTPRALSYETKRLCRFAGGLLAGRIDALTRESRVERTLNFRAARRRLIDRLESGGEVLQMFREAANDLIAAAGAASAAVCLEDRLEIFGAGPSEHFVREFRRWLNERIYDDFFQAAALAEEWPGELPADPNAAGAMASRLETEPAAYIFWFRPEQALEVEWAGNPQEFAVNPNARIAPRKSFERWKQQMRGRAVPWPDEAVESARQLSVLGAVIRRNDYQQKLIERERLFNIIADHTNDVIMLSEGSKTQFVSPSAARVSGFSMEELLGKSFYDFVHPEDAQRLVAEIKRDAEAGIRSSRYVGRWRNKDGSFRWLETEASRYYNEEGKLMTLAVSRDVTEERRQKAVLAEYNNFYNALIDNSPVGVKIYSPTGVLQRANAAAVRILGFPENSERLLVGLNGMEDENYIQSGMAAILRRAIEGNKVQVNEFPYGVAFNPATGQMEQTDDGKFLNLNVFPIKDGRGEITSVGVFMLDVTEQVRARKAQEERNKFVQTITTMVSDIIYVFDVQEQCNVYANLELAETLGYSSEEVRAMGKNLMPRLLHPEDLPRAMAHFEKILSIKDGAQSIIEFEYRMRRKAGGYVWLYSREVIYERDAEGKPKLILGVAQDVTWRKEHEARLVAAKDEAEAANRAKADFLAHLSHDLRNPLNILNGYLNLLEPTLDAGQKENLRFARLAYDKISKDIQNILDYSRLDARKLKPAAAPYDLQKQIRDLADLYGELCAQKGLAFKLEADFAQLPAYIQADESFIERILDNLLSNAVKFTEAGGVTLAVRVAQQWDELARLRFEVRDTGPGFEPKEREIVFEPFRQLDNSPTKKHQGVGLGLAISRKFAKAMGGALTADSEPGQGATFALEAPVGLASGDDEASAETPSKMPEQKKLSILVVEDDEGNAAYLRKFLEARGHKARNAYNGNQALRLLDKRRFDLVLMDGALPVMDGYETTRRLRETYSADALPVIAVTGYALDQELQKFYDAGANDHITKPIDEHALLKKIERLASAAAPLGS